VAEEDDMPKTDIDGDEDVKKILGLAKPLFIKVAIALIVVLLAAGAAVFFLTGEEPKPEDEVTEEVIDEDNLIDNAQDSEETEEDAMESGQIQELQEQLQQIQDQNSKLNEQLDRIETRLIQTQENNQKEASKAIVNNYGSTIKDFPPIDTEPPAPRPEPSWGDFKRVK